MLLCKICFSKRISLKTIKLIFNTEITLTVNGSGTQRILNNNDAIIKENGNPDNYIFGHKPSRILVNEEQIEGTNYWVDDLSEEINNITIIWDYPLTNSSSMFINLENITDIYFTEFDTSKVVSMDNMFRNCTSITKLDLSGFDTSLVTRMDNMFAFCEKLKDLKVSSFNTTSVINMNSLFLYCRSLYYLDITNFKTTSCKDIGAMFSSMIAIKSLNLNSFDTSSVVNMNKIFFQDYSLTSIDLSSFNTSSVTNMEYMFYDCYLLIFLDLSSFKTSSVINMNSMFSHCHSLTSLNIINFDTASVTDMHSMFLHCFELKTLDLSNFDTRRVTSMYQMFYTCDGLITLNIDNFDFSSVNSISGMFYNCSSLVSLDLHKLLLSNDLKNSYLKDNIFNGCNESLVLCFDNEGNNDDDDNNAIILNQLSNFKKNCSDICFMPERKIIPHISKCTMNCEMDDIYKYEYNNFCYQSCPNGTYYSYNNNYLCILGSEDEPEIESFGNFYSLCKYNVLYNGNKTKDEIIDNIRNDFINGNLDILITKYIIEDKKDFLVNDTDNGILYQFTSTYNQNNNIGNKFSTIKFGECEKLLREKYELKDNDIILIYKVEIYEQGLLIPIIYYEAYNPNNKQKIKLDECSNNNVKINIEIPVMINEEELFKYDSTNEYYNDFCFPYTTGNKTDITLNDRRNEFINNNMSLCENNCEYKGYDSINKKSLCECFIKLKFPFISEVSINKDLLLNNFKDLKKTINVDLMKCYKSLFITQNIKTNIGFYVMLFIIIITIILAIHFKVIGYKKLLIVIDKIIKIKKKNINIEINNNKDKDININNIKIIKRVGSEEIKINTIYQISKNLAKEKFTDYSYKKLQSDFKNSSDYNNRFKNNDNNNNIISKKIDKKKVIKINKYNDYEINNLTYEEALKIDKRSYMQYYFSLIKTKHTLIFTFYTKNDYNSRKIKVILFLFSFACYYTVNALFFTDSTIHKIYVDQGSFNFIYQIPKILYSTIISIVINVIVKLLSLSEKDILGIKNETKNVDKKVSKVLKCLLIKFILFFIFISIFLFLFWYYLSCFGAVYRNTQFHLFKNTVTSFILSLIYPFGLNIIPVLLRIPTLKAPNRNILYKISTYLQLI